MDNLASKWILLDDLKSLISWILCFEQFYANSKYTAVADQSMTACISFPKGVAAGGARKTLLKDD